jgi:membrane-associated protease RseP (regulator of RpoE activity)
VDTSNPTAPAQDILSPRDFLPAEFLWVNRPKFQDRIARHALLFLLTVLTTTLAGVDHYGSFSLDYLQGPPGGGLLALLAGFPHGLWYSATILAILGCHEMGHYLACRYYDVDASLPFFIPMPLVLTGTLGAFIRIREQIPRKHMLFDIGIAGPLAGFVVAVPALFIGLWLSRIDPNVPTASLPDGVISYALGEPLLFRAAAWLVWGSPPAGYSLNMHPVAFAAWFGLLATTLNLFPIGQLDGGHISYAVFGPRSSTITLLTVGVACVLSYFWPSWIVWTVLTLFLLFRFGRHHPPVFDEDQPLDRGRLALAAVALVIFVVCFTPAPIQPMEILRH